MASKKRFSYLGFIIALLLFDTAWAALKESLSPRPYNRVAI
jgi:hypothetical protein